MIRIFWTAVLVISSPSLLSISSAAESPEENGNKYHLAYKFQMGDEVRYDVFHRMSVRNTIDKETQEAKAETKSVKVWKIVDVLPNGEIELVNLVDRVHMTNQLPGQSEVVYDSKKDESPPPGFEDVAKAIGVPISVVRLSPQGEVLDREMKVHQPAADPTAPIAARLPEDDVAVGETWDEPVDVTVQLKSGGSKVIETRRHYKLTEVDDGVATIDVNFQVLSPIDAHMEAQLVQRLMKGTIEFDIEAGRVLSQQMDVDKRVLGFAGAASSMHYVMRMTESIVEDVPEVASKP